MGLSLHPACSGCCRISAENDLSLLVCLQQRLSLPLLLPSKETQQQL